MSSVDEIKAKLDIVEYIQRGTPLKKAGRVFKACCPFHSEKTPSFVVNPDNQTWRCFGACAEGGDVFTFAMKRHGWSFREALEELGQLTGVEVHQQTPEQRANDDALERLRGMVGSASDWYHERLLDSSDQAAKATLKYAREQRGLTDETIRRFGIGYAPAGWSSLLDMLTHLGYSENDVVLAGLATRNEAGKIYDRFRNRLIIPIRDERGRTVGFGARALATEDTPKYLNSPQSPLFDKSKLLFALDLAAKPIREAETVVIVEGYLDAIQAHQAGYTNVVAQMGTALTEPQLKRVAPRWAKKIILALDSDAAGQNATRRSLEVARTALQDDFAGKLGVEFRVLSIPDAKDPDDFLRESPEVWPEMVDNATPVAEFVIGMEVATLPPNASVQEREEAAKRLLPILTASENDLYRQDNLQKLAMKLRVSERDLMVWASEQPKARPARAKSEPTGRQGAKSSETRPATDSTGAPAWDDVPPPEEGDYTPEDDLFLYGSPTQKGEGTPSTPLVTGSQAYVEAYCLRALFDQPNAYYEINRKLREIAEASDALMRGPLADFGSDDFTRTAYRALMTAFEEALRQDEQSFVDHLRVALTDDLVRELEIVMQSEWDVLEPRLVYGLSRDLSVVRERELRLRGEPGVGALLIDNALRLRERRLSRERQELMYAQEDGAAGGEASEASLAYEPQIRLSITAKRRIDQALSVQARAPKERL